MRRGFGVCVSRTALFSSSGERRLEELSRMPREGAAQGEAYGICDAGHM